MLFIFVCIVSRLRFIYGYVFAASHVFYICFCVLHMEGELFCAPGRVAQEEDGLAVVTLPYLHFTKPRYGKAFVNSILSQNV